MLRVDAVSRQPLVPCAPARIVQHAPRANVQPPLASVQPASIQPYKIHAGAAERAPAYANIGTLGTHQAFAVQKNGSTPARVQADVIYAGADAENRDPTNGNVPIIDAVERYPAVTSLQRPLVRAASLSRIHGGAVAAVSVAAMPPHASTAKGSSVATTAAPPSGTSSISLPPPLAVAPLASQLARKQIPCAARSPSREKVLHSGAAMQNHWNSHVTKRDASPVDDVLYSPTRHVGASSVDAVSPGPPLACPFNTPVNDTVTKSRNTACIATVDPEVERHKAPIRQRAVHRTHSFDEVTRASRLDQYMKSPEMKGRQTMLSPTKARAPTPKVVTAVTTKLPQESREGSVRRMRPAQAFVAEPMHEKKNKRASTSPSRSPARCVAAEKAHNERILGTRKSELGSQWTGKPSEGRNYCSPERSSAKDPSRLHRSPSHENITIDPTKMPFGSPLVSMTDSAPVKMFGQAAVSEARALLRDAEDAKRLRSIQEAVNCVGSSRLFIREGSPIKHRDQSENSRPARSVCKSRDGVCGISVIDAKGKSQSFMAEGDLDSKQSLHKTEGPLHRIRGKFVHEVFDAAGCSNAFVADLCLRTRSETPRPRRIRSCSTRVVTDANGASQLFVATANVKQDLDTTTSRTSKW